MNGGAFFGPGSWYEAGLKNVTIRQMLTAFGFDPLIGAGAGGGLGGVSSDPDQN